jgi:hypothetical protein
MEIFRELAITLNQTNREDFIKMLEEHLPAPWLHNVEAESQIKKYGGGPTQYSFKWRGTDDLPSASLWLTEMRCDELQVTNIVPTEVGKLTRSQYNSILLRFVEDVLRPAAELAGVQYRLSGENTSVEETLGPSLAAALTHFSDCANKSTGSAHPSDFERWCRFLVEAHHASVSLDGHTLGRLLNEELRWPMELANDLVIEYEFGRNLLSYYDQHGDD